MEKEQALTIIEQALTIAIGKGVFKVEDSVTVLAAFITIKNVLNPPTPVTEGVEENVETPVKKVK